jgi:hypothetical protein
VREPMGYDLPETRSVGPLPRGRGAVSAEEVKKLNEQVEDKRREEAQAYAAGGAVKKSKSEVAYSKGMPKSHCGPVQGWRGGDCKHFRKPYGCALVEGQIAPRMWCKLHEARAGMAAGGYVPRRQGGGPVEEQPAEQPPADTPPPPPPPPAPPPSSGISPTGLDFNPNNLGTYVGPNLETWHPFTNEEVLNEIKLHPDSIGSYKFPSDPRVDAYWARQEEAGNINLDAMQNIPEASGRVMQGLLDAIPDAGRGTALGGANSFQKTLGPEHVPEPISAGSNLPSTNNWMLMPPPYNRPGFMMRNGRIIDTNSPGYKVGLQAQNTWRPENVAGVSAPFLHTAGYPTGFGQAPYQYYGWPGQIEPWGYFGSPKTKRGGSVPHRQESDRMLHALRARYAGGRR